ncbi:expressed unknown protein [Seminavis robusta]|uniref:Uncharacterized protein n=1 Tax=Seminavis robusta TaxID=568900 RepID=A0A9N8EAD2_9STRA|nr:expressed unknown protein [Seminavis robusta]|eukprot:Sro802_g204570.1 n/a (229) ;mRNA; f:6765-7647
MVPVANGFVPSIPADRSNHNRNMCVLLSMSLKPAAIPMMDSGKALARSGELLVDLTSAMDLYGGALSAVGAQIRNSGDCVAQAAASCRFKTGVELVCDELREGATCLTEATGKLRQAVEEAQVDQDQNLVRELTAAIVHLDGCATNLEAAGAAILQRKPLAEVGANLVKTGEGMKALSVNLEAFSPAKKEAIESGQRMAFAADRMITAGTELQGTTEKPKKGKSWLKG